MAAHRRRPHELDRFVEKLHQQAVESREERWPVYMAAGFPGCARILDVGCGPGAVTQDVVEATGGVVVALDAAPEMIERARGYLGAAGRAVARRVRFAVGEGHRLPFPDGAFDAVVCNLFLMWATDPAGAVKEMARVVRRGGNVVASLEPDFGGKIHYPEDERIDPVFRGDAIRRRGGDPHIGRKLRALFTRAGLDTVVGLGNRRVWSVDEELASFERTKDLYRSMLVANGFTPEEVDAWAARQAADAAAGLTFNFFPQFYAIGRKP